MVKAEHTKHACNEKHKQINLKNYIPFDPDIRVFLTKPDYYLPLLSIFPRMSGGTFLKQ